ncbi:putative secreted protein [Wickerhamomyces ciferrii]|uniref:Secreted protein n=1 Tax=Wickerhamomyces ciferrii (strain ATCC 14091 / BCRC 22168 / CBS 111 / JCM 3599 / NBRC 0793 / NRRL Y-1031 F-60-10) TaxID=1206466 RepID=K0KVS9_WICCF|nr:uncharacterized protein BN7_5660 [Wickerhamomyces ciferrii]CCH46072.1 putative secreted protein [Wickerhamomyces ciferrii]
MVLWIWILSYFIISVTAVDFLVQFQPNWSFDNFYQRYFNKKTIDAQGLKNLGIKTFEMGKFQGLMGELDIEMVRKLYYDKDVAAISIDRELVLADVQENAPKHLARLSQRQPLKPDQKHYDFVFDPTGGIGVDIYVLDSGINSQHKEFSKRVTKIIDLTGEKIDEGSNTSNKLDDPVGHGSFIAGVIASETYGVAKKANLFDVRVTNKQSRTKLSSVVNALNLILQDSKITKRPTLVVIPLVMKKNAILNGAVESLVKQGIPVIVPAGNEGKQACNFSPASAKGALTVGAIDVNDEDSIPKFSNWGACVDVFAPGVKVKTTGNKENEIVSKTGTSLATGVTAGLVGYFMGMGDDGNQAIERIVNYSTPDVIPSDSLGFKPLTANRILFNCEGQPNW